jgi:4'-phosphopantetheinyl transferase
MADGFLRVWVRETGAMTAPDVEAALTSLSPDERERYARFHFDRDRRDYGAAHALLRTALTECDGERQPETWRFVASDRGKPQLAPETPAPFAFNLSHTRGCVAVAIAGLGSQGGRAGCGVGVDVEALGRDPDVDGIADRYFAPDEVAWLRQAGGDPRRERFFRLWTLKEACLKATGEGIAESLHAISFSLDDAGNVRRFAAPGQDATTWTFFTERIGTGFLVSIALSGAPKLQPVFSRI